MKKLVVALMLFPGAVQAESWSHSITRGLDHYQASGAGLTINLICDPARVYGSDNSGIELRVGAAGRPEGSVTFRSTDTVVEATALRGRIAPDAQAWPAILDLLGTEGLVQVEHGGTVYSLDMKEPAAFSCSA